MSAQPHESELLATALDLRAAGVLVFPASATAKHPDRGTVFTDQNGEVKPRWKPEYYPPNGWPTEAQQRAAFEQTDVRRMFVVAGVRSGNLAGFDFDDPTVFDAWWAMVPEKIRERLYRERSQRSGGQHVAVRGDGPVPASTVPAFDATRKVRIELRGEGGGFMAAPSLGYERVQGSLANLPVLSQADFTVLMQAAASFNEYIEPEIPPRPRVPRLVTDSEQPGNQYNREHGQAEVVALLERYGWRTVGRAGERVQVLRPGATNSAHSGSVYRDGTLVVFSENAAPFDAYRGTGGGNWTHGVYDPFGVYARLEHGGDLSAAGKTLYDERKPRRVRKAVASPNTGEGRSSPDSGSTTDTLKANRRLTDSGNAERLIDRHGTDLRFVRQRQLWAVWDGTRWVLDESQEIHRRAKDTVRAIYGEAGEYEHPAERKTIADWGKSSESATRRNSMVSLAQSEPGMNLSITDFDTDPWAINCRNGIVDLRTGQLRPHERGELHMMCVPATYDLNAVCPTWEAFLTRILPDPSVRRFVQRAIGYSLTGSTQEQKLFVAYGTGSNGKTTLFEAFATLLADYGQQARIETFTAKTHDGGIPNDLAAMVGARFISASESNEYVRLNTGLVKQLTGGDRIRARFLHREFFDFIPVAKFWLVTNHAPVIRDTSHGMWRRVVLIPFTEQIPDDEQDKELPVKLRAELSGILAWAVRGCLDWQCEGLNPPQTVQEATQQYRAEMDTFAAFITDRCAEGRNCFVTSAALYKAYRGWCEDTGERPDSQTAVGKRLRERGYSEGKQGGKRGWFGLTLAEHAIQQEMDTLDTLDTFSGKNVYERNYDQKGGKSRPNVSNDDEKQPAPPINDPTSEGGEWEETI